MSPTGDLEVLEQAARSVLPHYGFDPDTSCTLIHVSENATFALEDATGQRWALRLHRPGYQSQRAIESELAWSTALRNEAGVRTPAVWPGPDGGPVVEAITATGARRHCVLFEWLPGEHPSENDGEVFERLGALTAAMHRHSRRWSRPRHFTRFAWDLEAAFGPQARWGAWQDGIGVGPDERSVLHRLERALRRRLGDFGTGPERYGLVHADTRLDNLLVHRGELSVIDFDDCGFSWYLYDLATSVSFFEEAPQVPELIEHWLAGYRTLSPLPADDEREIWTLVLFRRLLLVAWLGSHRSLELAHRLGVAYTAGTCELAERHLGQLEGP